MSVESTYPHNHPRQVAISRKIALMMALDFRPFNIVENEGFRNLVQYTDPRYRMPSRPVFSMNLVPAIYCEVKMALQKDLRRTVVPFSFTTDMWRGQSTEYMCVTLHWLVTNEERIPQLRSALLGIQEFSQAATADNIRSRLEKVVDEWCHDTRAMGIMCGVSDNGANIKKCLRDAANNGSIHGSVSCLAHNLNLVVHDVMKTQRRILDGLTVLRKVVSKVKNSMPVKRKFEELLKIYYPNSTHIKLQADVETRWNSCLRMLSTILPQRLAIEALIQDRVMQSHGVGLPKCYNHWTDMCDTMQEFVKILEPFHEATLLCSKTTSSLSSYFPTLKGLIVSVERAQVRGIGTTKDQLLKKLQEVMATHIMSDDNDHIYLAATLLDPRYKKFIPLHKREQVESAVIDAIISIIDRKYTTPISAADGDQDETEEEESQQTQEYGGPYDSDIETPPEYTNEDGDNNPATPINNQPPPPVQDSRAGRAAANMEDASLMAGILASTEPDSDDDIAEDNESLRDVASRELKRYLQKPNIDIRSNQEAVLQYFGENGREFPNLTQTALSFLACPMSSVTSERMFSLAGNILTKKRCSLDPDNLNKLAVIKVNYHYIR
ncbi:zinc finger BED domain-containing protein 4-like [Lytechinus variegatus]|uniref:zinc finger BED domain-containing protein 4-like n=1 Tax=Lytechinus variegatus TaxID=7654 RepID=UPI001BB2240F|nr:zinc finger BED domain-containing protein 4-like [Lytechinus variegatus]